MSEYKGAQDVKDAPTIPLPPPTPGESSKIGGDGAPARNKSIFSIQGLKRSASNALQSAEGQAGTRLLKGGAKTIVGLHPIFLMGEALTGRKVGSQFRKGKNEVLSAAEELRGILGDSAKDILVIVDTKLKTQKEEGVKTAEILRSAGQDAIVVVTSSLLGSKTQFEQNAPGLKHSVLKNSKDVVVIVDKCLKNPIVITGVTKFAKAQGVPRPEAIMTIAALGVGKLIKILEEAEGQAKKELEKLEAEAKEAGRNIADDAGFGDVVVIDATEFEKISPRDQVKSAEEYGKSANAGAGPAPAAGYTTTAAGPAPAAKEAEPAVPGALPASGSKDKGKGKAKEDGCIVM